MSSSEFRFHPPDRAEMWHALALTMSQAAALTGVSERQIQHWMDRGYINPSSQGTRKLNGHGLDEVVLIRQARMAGIPLRQAVHLVRAYLQDSSGAELEDHVPALFLREVDEQLGTIGAGIERLQELLHHSHNAVPPSTAPRLPVRRRNRV